MVVWEMNDVMASLCRCPRSGSTALSAGVTPPGEDAAVVTANNPAHVGVSQVLASLRAVGRPDGCGPRARLRRAVRAGGGGRVAVHAPTEVDAAWRERREPLV